MQTVVIGLGSNQNPLVNLRRALLELRRQSHFKILKVSRIYESAAQLPENAPFDWDQGYLNAAVLIEIQGIEPLDLLWKLKEIETRLGRAEAKKWAPRTIDLDILYVENLTLQSDQLQIPHPMLSERPFAYLPALEVYPKMSFTRKNDHQAFNTKVSDRFFWPEFVGILNVTPDSFSDGGKYLEREKFLHQARKLIYEGADYLDLGAESTRPQAEVISLDAEWSRLKFALDHLDELKREGFKFRISIDSRNFETLNRVVENYKIDLVNDVSGFLDPKMLKLIEVHKLPAVCMHSLSVPADKNIVLKADSDPVEELLSWWAERQKIFADYNIASADVYFDPGFGFGKTATQSRYLVERLESFFSIKNQFFLGYSRKSFLGDVSDKDKATAEITQRINPAFCQLLRVHNIEIQKSALRASHAV